MSLFSYKSSPQLFTFAIRASNVARPPHKNISHFSFRIRIRNGGRQKNPHQVWRWLIGDRNIALAEC